MQLLYQSTINYQPSTSYYHADGNGNVTAMVNGNQLVVAKYVYDPFGNILSKSGPLADANTYRFSSQEYHQPSGLSLYLYRAYDPNLQRFINRDPIGELGGLNLYRFAGNNPINRIDPLGLVWYNPVDWYNGIVDAIADPIARLWIGGIEAQGNAAINDMLSAHDYNGMQDFQMQHPGYGGEITAGNTDATAAIANLASGSANLYVTAATMVTPTATGAKCLSILAKNGTKVTGFTGHGIERVIGDAAKRAGVKPQAILDALRSPTAITSGVDQLGRPYQIFTGENARVVVNPQTGQVVSVNPLSGAGAH